MTQNPGRLGITWRTARFNNWTLLVGENFECEDKNQDNFAGAGLYRSCIGGVHLGRP